MTDRQVPQIEPVYEKGWRKRDLDQLHTELAFHVLPTGENKLPLVKWRHGGTDYVEVKPTDVEVRRWARSTPAGWAVVCGGPNRLVCLDVEAAGMADTGSMGERIKEVLDSLPNTCQRRSPSGGMHAWVRVTDGAAPAGEKLMTRGDGVAEKPSYTLLVESRGHGQYAIMLGNGRGELSVDFAPCQVTLSELDELFERLRSVSDTGPRMRATKLGTKTVAGAGALQHDRQGHIGPMDTGDLLAAAVLDGALSWAHVLDDDWEDVGQTADGQTLWLRPDYGTPATSVSSATGTEKLGTPCLTIHTSAVPWAEPGRSSSPAQILADARFGGDYAEAFLMVERTAEALAVNGVGPEQGQFMADWPADVLLRIYAARSARQAAQGTMGHPEGNLTDSSTGTMVSESPPWPKRSRRWWVPSLRARRHPLGLP